MMHAIHVHTTPEPQSVSTWRELDSWATRKLTAFREDLNEDEIAASIGARGRAMSAARIALLEDLRLLIREAVAEEADESTRASAEDRYKDLDPVDDALTIRRLAGDR
jgi:hypothetical protein